MPTTSPEATAKPPRYGDQLEQHVRERIVNDLAEHQITAKRADGMYRHWRCQRPGTWNMGFDIITWPGSLCYTGDMGDYLFQRTEDMVEFMRRSCMSYSYAAEKCVAHDGRLKEFREETFNEVLDDLLAEILAGEREDGIRVMRAGRTQTESITEKIEAIRTAYSDCNHEFDASKAMYESGIWDGCDMPSLTEYTFHFLWCLHAIKWFCERV